MKKKTYLVNILLDNKIVKQITIEAPDIERAEEYAREHCYREIEVEVVHEIKRK